MKKKKKNKYLYEESILNNNSINYTIAELIELGKRNNKVEIAPPLYKKKNIKN